MTDAEHPDGLLIDDAAKLHFPRLYTAWQEAWRQWSELGQGASYTVVKGKLINSELYHPYLVAAVVAGEALKSACRREFAKPDWVVTCLEGRARVPIDGDFLREADLMLRDGSALGGSIRDRTLVTALRVRRVVPAVEAPFEPPAWMDPLLPWKTRIAKLCEAVWSGTLPLGLPAAPEALIKRDFAAHKAKAKCLRWFSAVTGTPINKDNRPLSALEKGFRDYRKNPKAE
jgi:hypothetical protein